MDTNKVTSIGCISWNVNEIRHCILDFLTLYANRPIKDNDGGMVTPHMFATWFMLKKINPKFVVESGIWKGQGTWLIESAAPNATIISLDINLDYRQYISDKVIYYEKDFSKVNWDIIDNKKETILFFDDHQNAFKRIIQAKKQGFKHLLFEDNYPARQGDCYSLKKTFLGCGFTPIESNKSPLRILKNKLFGQRGLVKPNTNDRAYLEKTLEIYYEFPPIFKKELTRWGDQWNEEDYPTPEALYEKLDNEYLRIFYEEAIYYTWICYVKLK